MQTATRTQAEAAPPSTALGEACDALDGVIPRFADLVRSAPDPAAPAVGCWTVAEVAAHVGHACAGNLLAARTLGPSPTEAFPEGDDLPDAAARFNAWNLAGDPERDLSELASRIEQRGAELVTSVASAAPDHKAAWLAGAVVPAPALPTHLLLECLVHGHDIARASGRRWPIARSDAAIAGRFLPLLFRCLTPAARASFVDPAVARDASACFDVRVREGGRNFFVFERGVLTVEDPSDRPVDCHISADPVAFLLVGFKRVSVMQPALTGRIVAWGRKPWLAFKFTRLLRSP
jgi:hypothetical protein